MKKIIALLFCFSILGSYGQFNENPDPKGMEVYKTATLPNGRQVTYYMASDKWRVMEKEEKAYYKELVEKIRELVNTAIPKGWELDKSGYTGYGSETFYFTRSYLDDQRNRPNLYSWSFGIIPSVGNPLRDSIMLLAEKFQEIGKTGNIEKIWEAQQNRYSLNLQVELNASYFNFHSKTEVIKETIPGAEVWLLHQKGKFWMEKNNPSDDAQPKEQPYKTWLIAGKLNQVEFNKQYDGYFDSKLEEKKKEPGYCKVDNIKIEIKGQYRHARLFIDKLNIALLNEILAFKTTFP